MSALAWIIQRLNDLSSYFYDAYREVLDWVYPFWYLAIPLYQIQRLFNELAWDFYDFYNWANDVSNRIGAILSWSNIWSYILQFVPNLPEIRDWFYNWRGNVWIAIIDFWGTATATIQGWISVARAALQTQLDNVNNLLTTLRADVRDLISSMPTLNEVIAWWSNWTGNVLAFVNTWWNSRLLEVQGLIDSAFVTREQFWTGWQDLRSQVGEFFGDPEDQVLKILERALERYW